MSDGKRLAEMGSSNKKSRKNAVSGVLNYNTPGAGLLWIEW